MNEMQILKDKWIIKEYITAFDSERNIWVNNKFFKNNKYFFKDQYFELLHLKDINELYRIITRISKQETFLEKYKWMDIIRFWKTKLYINNF